MTELQQNGAVFQLETAAGVDLLSRPGMIEFLSGIL